MKIKIDENLPLHIAARLKSLGNDVHTVQDEGIGGGPDHLIWETAQREERFLITQDLDFSDARRFAPGTHHGILVIRLHSPSRLNLIERIEELFRNENVSGWASCFVVATDRKVRVRRPPGAQNY
jgi:predicted nuclease of predicted toxin-antitoxin system